MSAEVAVPNAFREHLDSCEACAKGSGFCEAGASLLSARVRQLQSLPVLKGESAAGRIRDAIELCRAHVCMDGSGEIEQVLVKALDLIETGPPTFAPIVEENGMLHLQLRQARRTLERAMNENRKHERLARAPWPKSTTVVEFGTQKFFVVALSDGAIYGYTLDDKEAWKQFAPPVPTTRADIRRHREGA